MRLMQCRLKQRAVTVSAAFAAVALLGGCFSRDQLPYHVIHNPVDGHPRHIFADPIGYRYPDIVPSTRPAGLQPLPLQRRSYFEIKKSNTAPKEPSTEPAVAPKPIGPADAPLVKPPPQPSQKQTILRPARDRFAVVKATEPATDPVYHALPAAGVPTVEVVPPLVSEGRASTQLRR